MNSYEYRDNLGNPRDYYDIVNDATKLCEEIEEKDKEIERLNNKIHDMTDILNETYNHRTELRNENKRLNNIINELEKDIIREENKNNEALKNKYKMGNYLSERAEETIGIENDIYDYVLTRLQELKEGK